MQPIILEDRISIAANSTVSNVLASSNAQQKFLRAPFQAAGVFMVTATVTGLIVTLSHGSREVVFNAAPRVGTDMQYPLDAINPNWFVEEGEMLGLTVVNPTGGAIVLAYRIILTPFEGELPPDDIVMQVGPTSIANNTFALDQVNNLKYSRAPVDSILSIWMTASAVGILREVFVDTDCVAPLTAVPALNRVPQDPFDLVITGIEVPQDKPFAIPLSNASGGALNVFWRATLSQQVRR